MGTPVPPTLQAPGRRGRRGKRVKICTNARGCCTSARFRFRSMFGDNSMEQRELPVQLEQKPVKEPELNATAFVPSVLASAFVPSMQGPSDVTAISEVSNAWQTHQMNSELHFATEAFGTGHQVLERTFSQKKEDC